MKNTHTPGPWSAAADGTQWKISTLAFANDQTDGPDNVGPVPLKGTLENARLIAAAPDLLDALQAVCDAYGDRDTLLIAQCKAALAKAKGDA